MGTSCRSTPTPSWAATCPLASRAPRSPSSGARRAGGVMEGGGRHPLAHYDGDGGGSSQQRLVASGPFQRAMRHTGSLPGPNDRCRPSSYLLCAACKALAPSRPPWPSQAALPMLSQPLLAPNPQAAGARARPPRHPRPQAADPAPGRVKGRPGRAGAGVDAQRGAAVAAARVHDVAGGPERGVVERLW